MKWEEEFDKFVGPIGVIEFSPKTIKNFIRKTVKEAVESVKIDNCEILLLLEGYELSRLRYEAKKKEVLKEYE